MKIERRRILLLQLQMWKVPALLVGKGLVLVL